MAQKITYDITSTPKLIRINDGVTEIDVQVDLYSDVKEDWVSNEQLSKITIPFSTVGGEPLSATQFITGKYFLSNEWRIKPFEGDHELTITGDLFSAVSPPDPLVISTSGNFTTSILFDRGVESITTIIQVSGSNTQGGSTGVGTSTGTTTQFTWELGTGEVPLFFDFQFGGDRVTGEDPTVEVYRNSDDYVLDWNQGIFVASPSGNEHLGSMTESALNSGVYKRDFDPQNYGQTENTQIYYMQYTGIVPSGFNSITSSETLVRTDIHKFNIPSGIGTSDIGMTATFVG